MLLARLWAIAVVTVGGVIACDSLPLTAPTSSTISVSIDQTTLPLNGRATVRAILIESAGTPVHNGTQVVFSTTLGTFTPAEVETLNGVATTIFLAGSISGTTRINAYSGGTSTGSGNNSGGGVEVKIGAAAAGSLAVVSTPPSVSQSGGTVTISALVLDASNNPLPGVSVLFTATNGVLSATTAMSDSSGLARTTLTTSTTSTVRATASSTANGEVIVTVSSAPAIAITAPDTGTVGVPVAISVSITAGGTGGNSSPRQVESLTIDYGDGSVETRTNVTGQVGLTHTYQQARGFTITATARDVTGNTGIASKAIVINHAPLPTVGVTASPNPVLAASKGQTTISVTASPSGPTVPIRSVRATLADGTVIYSGTGPGSVPHKFGGGGSYVVNATATDANGETATTSTVVVVEPYTP